MGLGLSDLPPFNWLVERPANDHAHVVWALAEPIHRYPAARAEPLRYFAGIAEYYAFSTNADASYAGVLAHNPACRFKSPYRTTWGREAPYTLYQLATVIPFNWTPPSVRQTGVGRNVDLFEAGMRWAGRQANASLPVLPALHVANQDFAHPLPLSEVQATARSIEKYRKRWAGAQLALSSLDIEASGTWAAQRRSSTLGEQRVTEAVGGRRRQSCDVVQATGYRACDSNQHR